MHPLSPLGWSPHFDAALEEARREAPHLLPARVSEAHRDSLRVLLSPGEDRLARTGGRLLRDSVPGEDRPAVGDFVAVEVPPVDGPAVVRRVLPRRSALARKEPDRSVAVQILAANVDTVVAVVPLDRPFRPRLVERILALAWDGGADPVVLLAKADLVPDAADRVREAGVACPGAPVLSASAATGAGVEGLSPWLRPGSTIVLLGQSGAGKSTLANRLLGADRMETGAVRALDARGRHTTVHRQLLPLPSGAVLVDTPGLREVALVGAPEGREAAFPEVAALAARCRFRDCRHGTEPGCAGRSEGSRGARLPSQTHGGNRAGPVG